MPPDSGIYACRVVLCASKQVHDATMSVGNNPTFGDVRESQVEAHLHDVAANLYGQVIEIRIVQRIRDMINFDTVDNLILSTAQDVVQSREILSAAPHECSSQERAAVATLEKKEVVVHVARDVNEVLDAEVRRFQAKALEHGSAGILVTRQSPGRFTLELSHDVPFGYTYEKA